MSNSLQPHGLQPVRLLCPWGFSRPEYWSGLPGPPPGDLPNPGLPPLQVDSLPAEPQGKPKNTEGGSLSHLQRIFPTQELNRGLLRWRQILYQLRHQGSLKNTGVVSYSFLQGIFPTQEWNLGLPSELPGNHFETQCEALIKVIALLHISCFTSIV